MPVTYNNSDKLFRARRIVASQKNVNIELVPDQDEAVLAEYVKLAGAYEGELETVKETKAEKTARKEAEKTAKQAEKEAAKKAKEEAKAAAKAEKEKETTQ